MHRYVDLSHRLEDGMRAYPGLPDARIGPILDHAGSRPRYLGKAEFYLGRFEFPGNVGTYLDSPFHRYPDGADLAAIALDRLAGLPAIVFDAPAMRGPVVIEASRQSLRDHAVLIRTGWDERWGTDRYWEPGPWLAEESIDLLIRAGAALAGVDFWNVDDTSDLARPAHTRLLSTGVLIVEHLANLGALPQTGFRFYAVPPRIVRGASFPVRAFAEIP